MRLFTRHELRYMKERDEQKRLSGDAYVPKTVRTPSGEFVIVFSGEKFQAVRTVGFLSAEGRKMFLRTFPVDM